MNLLMYQKWLQGIDHLCQKFGHGPRVVEQEKTLIGALGVAQRLVHCSKVGQNGPKLAKIQKSPVKKGETNQSLVMKHLFWSLWLHAKNMYEDIRVGGGCYIGWWQGGQIGQN